MADKSKSDRKPVSLNDSHRRILQGSSNHTPPPQESLPLGEWPSRTMLEEKHLCSTTIKQNDSPNDDVPHFSGFSDFESSPEEKGLCTELARAIDDHDDIPTQLFGFVDSSSSPGKKKPAEIKVEGRNRLCRVSSGDENAEHVATVHDELEFSDILDFNSPLPPETSSFTESDGGVSKIQNVLNELSIRDECLSIEPETVPDDPSEEKGLCKELVGATDGHDDIAAQLSGFVDLSSSPGKKMPAKIKVEGRNRLCRVSSGDESAEHVATVHDELEFSDILDFNSPSPPKTLCFTESDGGASKIQNVLNELSNRVECLSIEPETVPVDPSGLVRDSEKKEERCSIFDTMEEGKTNSDGYRSMMKIDKKSNKESIVLQRGLRLDDESDGDDDDCVAVRGQEVSEEPGRPNLKNEDSDGSVIHDPKSHVDVSVLEDEGFISLAGPISTYSLPGAIAKKLYPHQHEGLRWLWSLHCQGKGGILGDDMGLGKTMQICGFLAGLFCSGLMRRALIVAPKTVLSHWNKELSAVGLSAMIKEYFGTSVKLRQYELHYVLQNKGILLTTYDIVRNNSKSLQGSGFMAFEDGGEEDGFTWDYMILDEGHIIKNPSTQRAKSLLEIPSSHRILITGTPIQNNLKELWALFNFCCPDLLGDHKWFKERYEYPILRGNEKNASDREKRIGSAVAKELREHIQPYFLRRLKNEVFKEDDETIGKLSKKHEMIVWLRLTSCQRQLYEAFLQSDIVLSAFDGSPLAALTILKKICDHPLLLTKRAAEDVLEGMHSILNPEDADLAEKLAMHVVDSADKFDFQEKHDNLSCKISFILSLLDNLIPQGHNVLIFSQTCKMLNLLQESLVSKGHDFIRIDGTTKASDRVKIVNDFQEGVGAPIFLLTSQVGGLGLTLTNADRVIIVDPAWNPSTDNQSVDRAYRIGQKKDVLVYRLMTCGTVEEKIYRKQIYKGGLFKTATESKEQIRYFSQRDLRDLFCLPKQGFDVSLTQQQLHEEHDHLHKMDEPLEDHMKFLENQGIAGVSHHSLLFSKSAPVQVILEEDEEEEIRKRGSVFYGNSRSYHLEPVVDGAAHAFNPKHVPRQKKGSSNSSDLVENPTESMIKENIDRLSQILRNEVAVSRLPDRGEKLLNRISELNAQLYKMKKNAESKIVIDVDELSGGMQRVLNV